MAVVQEIDRVDGTSVGRDRKTGFCLGDRYERTSLELPGKPDEAIWVEECRKGESDALRVRQGISPGYGDPYVPAREGQSIDVTGLPPSSYVLVHRVNPERELRESDYENNAASALIALSRERDRLAARLFGPVPICPSARHDRAARLRSARARG
ncbi:MAG: lysyl oxidase family protein [Actinomycetota bacterium]|nr:lysyl oxidase family protein [Actinomycetota bacterium]